MTGLILFPISFFIMLFLFHFDYISKLRIIYAVIMSAIIQVILLLTSSDTYWTGKCTLFLTLLAVATYTDIKEEKILNINIILLYIAVFIGIIFDFFSGVSHHQLTHNILILVIMLLLSMLLTLIKAISSGDIPLILALVYLWPDYIIIVLGISAVIFLLYSTPRILYKIHKHKNNKYYVAAAPSFLIASFLFLLYKQFFTYIY